MASPREALFRRRSNFLDKLFRREQSPKNMKPETTILTILLAALLCGCAGTYFTFDKAREVKVGMTEAEVQKIMGSPYMVTSSGGKQIWVYSFATGFGSARSVSYAFADGKVTEVPKIPNSFGQTGSGIATP